MEPSRTTRFGVLVIGNFLSPSVGTVQASASLGEKLAEAGCRVLSASSVRFRPLRLAHMLWVALVRRASYQVGLVDVFSGPAFHWAEEVCRLLRLLGKPHVLVLRGGNLPVFAQQNSERVRRVLSGASAVVAPTAYLARAMRPYCMTIYRVAQGLEVRSYGYRLRDKVRPRMVWLRAYEGTYNPWLALEALRELLREFPEATLAMAGPVKDGSVHRSLQVMVSEQGLAGQVALYEAIPKPEVPLFLGQGDIFLNTSDYDNAPVSVLEAMAAGLCVVSTDVGGMRDMLDDSRNGLLVPPRDPGRMAGAVRRIITEPGLSERLSRNAGAEAQKHDWHVVLPHWLEILRAVAQGRSPDP
ncbi:MAG: glycosyltransferase family 4 protein [Kiritimatiellae bacterium]|nr:glycosyltransferase family 4 protein [Kiritimatiellia bacterium]